MRHLLSTDPLRHLLEHAAVVCGFALLAFWWWILLKDGPEQFGPFKPLAMIASYPTGGVFFPTTMMMPIPHPEGAGAIVAEYVRFAVTAIVWMNGPVWLTIAFAGPVRHRFRSRSDAAISLGAALGTLSFQRALPEYFIAAGASAAWGAYKYSQLVAVTADEAMRFLLLCAVPAALVPTAIMALRRGMVRGWRHCWT